MNTHEPMLRLLGMVAAKDRADMLRLYRTALADHVTSLVAAVGAGHVPEAVRLAHMIAGSAGMMQDAALSQPARRLEFALREGVAAPVENLLAEVREAAVRTLGVLADSYPDCLRA